MLNMKLKIGHISSDQQQDEIVFLRGGGVGNEQCRYENQGDSNSLHNLPHEVLAQIMLPLLSSNHYSLKKG